MNFQVHDRRSIERGIILRTPYILISIRDPEKRPVRYRRPAGLIDVLSLAFHDAELCERMALPSGIRLKQPPDAVRIWEFVNSYRNRIGTIVCHCEQGLSRSPPVALALAESLGG